MSVLSTSIPAGCVAPIAPVFHDDPTPANDPPSVVSATPPLWSLVPPLAEGDQKFTLILEDLDVKDTLQIRWMFDYPPQTADTRPGVVTSIPGGPGATKVQRNPVSLVVDCKFSNLASGLKEHRVTAVISDRPFWQPGDADWDPRVPFESLPPDANKLTVGWILQKECQ